MSIGGCSFQINGETKNELMKQVSDHAKTAHNLPSIPLDVMTKVTAAVASMQIKNPF
jgi:predicted small metal-binding protein